MSFITVVYFGSVLVNLIGWIGDKDYPLAVIVAFIPFLNVVTAFGAVGSMTRRISDSKWKCTFGHIPEEVYDTEKEKWKYSRRKGFPPVRISMGGHTEYECRRCGHNWTEYWNAFD